jgi:hypothetical protein
VRLIPAGGRAYVATQANRVLRGGADQALVVAGLLDAAMSSQAGFLAGVYAGHFLQTDLLGGYAIFFAAFVLAGFVPASLYLLQTRVEALTWPQRQRLALVRLSLGKGALFGIAAAAFTPLAGVALIGELSLAEILPLASTTVAVVVLSPLQDHVRASFHLAGHPWRAVTIAAVHLASLFFALVVLHFAPVSRLWVPLGSLALANLVSLTAGFLLARPELSGEAELPDVRRIVGKGSSLLAVSIVPVLAQFLAASLVASFRSVEDAGHAELARIVATPVHVLALGVAQALTPGLMQAGQSADAAAARRLRGVFALLVLACAAVYLPLAGPEHALNPMARLLPNAFDLQGLVLLSVLALVVLDLGLIPRAELAGAERARQLVAPSLLAAAAQIAMVAALMWSWGAYVIPAGVLACHAVLTCLAFLKANRLYASRDGIRG